MKSTLTIIIVVTFLFGCSENSNEENENSCKETDETYTLSGSIVFDDYESGTIDLIFVESSSSECGEEDREFSERTPGYELGQLSLEEPGEFSIDLTHTIISYSSSSNVIIRAVNDPDEDGINCEGQALMVVEQATNSNIIVDMTPGECPYFE